MNITHARRLIALPRLRLSAEALSLLVGAYLAAAANHAFLGHLHALASWPVVVAAAVAIAGLNAVFLLLVPGRRALRCVATLLLLVSAAAAHHMDAYGVHFDRAMLRNVLRTHPVEAFELLTPSLAWSLFAYGVLPAILVWRIEVPPRGWRAASWARPAWIAGTLVTTLFALLLAYQDLSSVMRRHKALRYLVAPGNVVVSLAGVLREDVDAKTRPMQPLGRDARVADAGLARKPRLLVIVVGETVRAANWGLNGYARQTTPRLAGLSPINFRNVSACGTSTEVSLPCMFSPDGRANFDAVRTRRTESLLHVLHHAGVATRWRDNQSGCKGVCEGLPFESTASAQAFDEILVEGLDEAIAAQTGDAVFVLHPLGNHGPAYWRRYPPGFRQFVPDCRTVELGACTREEIVNAYDNAVLYADHVVASTIDVLQRQVRHDTALLYVSDHGESLGEAGLYLHGLPYAIAPRTQTRVPMLAWLSPGFVESNGLDVACLHRIAGEPASHDNVFDSVLGLMRVETSVYAPQRDLFARCAIPRAAVDQVE